MSLRQALWAAPTGETEPTSNVKTILNTDPRFFHPERTDYFLRPIPVAKDELIRDALRTLKGQTQEEITAELQCFTLEDREMLDTFAVRMASLAVRTGDVQHIRDGLFAQEIAAQSGPILLQAAAPLFHACNKVGVDPREEFLGFAVHATSLKESALIIAKKGIPLEATGLREGRDADGFRFIAQE